MSLTSTRPLRARERESALALLTLAVFSALFVALPELDLWLSTRFYDAAQARFPANDRAWVMLTYDAVPWLGRGIGLIGLVVALLAWRRPRLLGVRWWRRSMLAALVMALGVGGLVNGVLKEQWGRARPVHLSSFGGTHSFSPAWTVSQACQRNCSFVSGHAATGFALLAVGALGAPATRRRWWLLGMTAGALFGLARVAQGAHFLSDVVLAGLLLWVSSCALRWCWLRVRAEPHRLGPRQRNTQAMASRALKVSERPPG